MSKREPTSQRHPSDELVERLRETVEAAAVMPVEDMLRGMRASAERAEKAFDDEESPEDIIHYALTAATMALALYQSLDDFKIHKTGTPLELIPIGGKGAPS